jgi:hypothetical protein
MDAEAAQALRRANSRRHVSQRSKSRLITARRHSKHVLLPVWLLTYQYGGTTYRIVANGITGAIGGKYPKSWIKIGFLVLAILIVLLIVFYAQN